MTDSMRGPNGPGITDRLSQLRASTGSAPLVPAPSRRMRLEVWVGALLVLAGVALLLMVRGGPDATPVLTIDATGTTVAGAPATGSAGLLAGEALFSFAVDDGDYPPSLDEGDQVRLVVTPGTDGTGAVRTLREPVVVVSVDGPSETGTRRVVTVRGPEALLVDLAGSGPVRVAIVAGGRS